jgi:hypothetical protein
MNMYDINSLVSGQKASDGSLQPGRYPGFIADVIQTTSKGEGKPVFDVKLKTHRGQMAWYRIWDLTQADMEKARVDVDFKEKLIKKIQSVKRVFVDVGIARSDEVVNWGWLDQTRPEQTIIGNLANLIGRNCTIVIAANQSDPSKTVTYIGAPMPGATQQQAPNPVTAPYGQQAPAPYSPPPMTQYQQQPAGIPAPAPMAPPYQAPQYQAAPHAQPVRQNLDQVPF